MGLFSRLFGGPRAIRSAIQESYDTHRGAHSASDSSSPHARGLYGALEAWYLDASAPRPEIQIWTELVPFLLMDEGEAVEALAEIVVSEELPLEARTVWLGERIRSAIRERLPTASDSLKTGAARALRQGHRPWLAFITRTEQEVIEGAVRDAGSPEIA